jgi:dTDP-4-amino-4,6-dideoxygalactose transaminase
MEKPRIFLSPPHMCGKELEYVQEAFASNYIAPVGPHVDAFEKEFCDLIGVNHAAAVSSGTAALHLALQLSNVGYGDSVACSTFTFGGSAFPIRYLNATPIFIDSERQSWNMDPNLLEDAAKEFKKKSKPIKAVIVVHLYGQAADIDSISAICNKYDIVLIEDAAESLGATYKGKNTGAIGPLAVFSFNGNKIVTTSGGGMLVSNNKEIVEKARFLATQARDPVPYYEHSSVGYNYRLSNISAAIGRGQLSVLYERIKRKREIFAFYQENLSLIDGFEFMPQPLWSESTRWLTCLTIDPAKTKLTAEELRLGLEKQNVESRRLWKPMHLQPVFNGSPAFTSGVSEYLFRHGICLPSGTNLTVEQLDSIVRNITTLITLRRGLVKS